MTKLTRVFRELGRNLARHPATALGSLLSLALLFLLFELYWVAADTSALFYSRLLSELSMEVFLSEDTADSTVPALQTTIADIGGIASVEYVSKEQARVELNRLIGTDLLVGYDSTNPLPRSLMLSFSPEYLTTAEMADIEGRIEKMPGVSHIAYSKRWLEKAESTRTVLLNIGMVLGALILATALITSVNSIRLMTQARAVGFYQMRLLGAGKLFLALPLLIEGLLIGGLSAAAGWVLIYYGRQQIAFTQFEVVIPTLKEIAFFCGGAAILGMLSGYLGIRRLLR
jgi:cell division transport system permease protein